MPINYIVRAGDSIPSLSFEYGFSPDTIWQRGENAELRQKRINMNVLLPGDRVFIPDKQLKELDKPTDAQHVFRRKGTPSIFRLQLFDLEKPLADQKYQLFLDGAFVEGATDADGVLQHRVEPNVKSGKLVFPDSDKPDILLEFGNLDPGSELIGVQKRLNNLGFYCGKASGAMSDATARALLEFQNRFELPATGEADAVTVAKLVELHDQDRLFPEQPQNSDSKGSVENAFA